MTDPTKTTESQIQSETLRLLSQYPNLRIWRQNTGQAKFGNRVVKFGIPGAADLSGIAAPRGIRIEIELKKPGGRQSQAQKNYASMIHKHGGIYICADDPQHVIDCLKHHGVIQ